MPPVEKLSEYDEQLAAAWIENCRAGISYGFSSPKVEATFWAFEELTAMCSHDPMRALQVVIRILHTKPEDRVIWNLAAGPLEDLLVKNGEAVIGRLEQLAQEDSAAADLIIGVWTNSMAPNIVSRLEAIVGKK